MAIGLGQRSSSLGSGKVQYTEGRKISWWRGGALVRRLLIVAVVLLLVAPLYVMGDPVIPELARTRTARSFGRLNA